MKPRNKYEKRVAELNATLSEDIAESNVNRIKEACKDWDMTTYCYFTIHSNMQEFMVRRLYRVYKFTDKSTDHFFFVEIMREFNDGDRKTLFSKKRIAFGVKCYDSFSFDSDIELKHDYQNYCGYTLAGCFRLSNDSMPEDNTCSRISCAHINPREIGRIICDNPVAETLYKNHDPLFGYLLWNNYAKQVCRAITLAKRHGFVFSEETAAIWFDMVRAIVYCEKDWHNPVYIAPKDLQATHDMFVDMMHRKKKKDIEQRIRKQEELRLKREYEAIRKQLEADKTINEKYIKRRKKFYNMVLTDGLIECRVLRDIKEFEEEGTAMAHCVFKCKYYDRPYSLILSARIGGARIETIEVDLSKYTIKQSYGKGDHFTMYHKRIIDLVNAQMDTIKAYNRNRHRTTKKQIAV